MTTENIIKGSKIRRTGCGNHFYTLSDAADEFYQDFLFNEELMVYSADQEAD